jgi:hypothetical protein
LRSEVHGLCAVETEVVACVVGACIEHDELIGLLLGLQYNVTTAAIGRRCKRQWIYSSG